MGSDPTPTCELLVGLPDDSEIAVAIGSRLHRWAHVCGAVDASAPHRSKYSTILNSARLTAAQPTLSTADCEAPVDKAVVHDVHQLLLHWLVRKK